MHFWLVLAAASLSIAGMMAMTASMSGVEIVDVDRASIVAMVFDTPMGLAWQIRMAALFSVILLVKAVNSFAASARSCAAAAALASLAWTGHGAAGFGIAGWVQLVADITHLLAAGAWLGALVALGLILARNAARLSSGDFHLMHHTLNGFSKAGTIFVALLVVSGAINIWILVGPQSVTMLLDSQYVQLLAVKLMLFVGMLGLAAVNRFRFTPALSRDLIDEPVPSKAINALRRSIATEITLATLLLASVAWLGTLAPPAAL